MSRPGRIEPVRVDGGCFSEPIALLAPLGETLLVLALPFLLFLHGPFAGIIHQFLLLFAGPLAFLERLARFGGGHQLA